MQLAVEYESNAMIVKVDTDDEYEFARDMQVFTSFSSCCYIYIYTKEGNERDLDGILLE